MATHTFSQRTHDRLKDELYDLTTRGRIEIAKKIEAARLLGDLSENGDYHAAKDEQGHMEGRIRHLEHMLDEATVVPDVKVVTILFEGDSPDMAETYLLGHPEEKTDDHEVLSMVTELGKALQSAEAGQQVEYQAPNGSTLRVQVLKVERA
jgi:transcription elongation factor GreA